MIHVVSVRVGTKYGPEYVAILHDMIGRNLSTTEHKHWCVTDDPNSLPDYVTAIPHKPSLPGWWQKVYLFSRDMPWEKGERVVYFDLDVAITGRLEDVVERKGIISDWHWPGYNSSVMVWDHGEHSTIWAAFDPWIIRQPSPTLGALLPKGQINGGDQEWIGEVSKWDTFPPDWFVSYRDAQAWPPAGCKAVIFHGEPKPSECGGWVPDIWRIGGFTSLPRMSGVNTSYDQIWDNVRSAVQRDLPWFTGYPPRKGTGVLVCGGPSLKDSLDAIRDHKRRGSRITTVNNAMNFLMANGIVPDAHIILDAREENAAFVEDAPHIKYFLASQVHPKVFDALRDREVILWHHAIGNGEEMEKVVEPYLKGREMVQVPGGGTVGLRGLFLYFFSGYRKIHVYGMDGSYHGEQHHAYDQPLNDGEMTMTVAMGGRTYQCAKWMARQAEEFREHYHLLRRNGAQVFVHGFGLIPDMAAQLRREAA